MANTSLAVGPKNLEPVRFLWTTEPSQMSPTRPRRHWVAKIDRFDLGGAAREASALWKTRRIALRRAERACELGDALMIAKPPGFRERANRAYLRVGSALGRSIDRAVPAANAHALLREIRRPYRKFAIALGATFVVVTGSLIMVAVLLASVSRPVRHLFVPPNLAEHAAWRASSAVSGSPGSGRGTDTASDFFFHTQWESRPWVQIELPRAARIREIRVHNRADCCQERALPLNIEVPDGSGWRLVCQRRTPFNTWSCHPRALTTTVLRISTPGQSFLHLKSVAVFE